MTVRHTILAVGAVLVMGMAIYLVREVSRTPSDAQAHTEPREEPPTPTPPPTPPPTRSIDPPTRAVLPPTAPPKVPTPPPDLAVPADRPTQVVEVQPPEQANIMQRANPKLDAVMAEANRHYDQGDFDEAKNVAVKVLEKSPGNVRMLRIIVSSECIAGDSAEAQKYFTQLPVADRAQMRTRCDRYGVTLKDP